MVSEQEICEMYATRSVNNISALVGLGARKITKILKTNGVVMRNYTDKHKNLDIQLIYDTYLRHSTQDTAKILGIEPWLVRYKIRQGGFKTMPKGNRLRLDANTVKSMYESGTTLSKISTSLSVSETAISKCLKKNGVEIRDSSIAHRSTTLNHNCFDEITEESAYWAGFLMADGTISGGGHRNSINLALCNVDEKHIEKFRSFVGSSATVCIHRTKNNRLDGSPIITTGINICSAHMVKSLSRLGVIAHKTSREHVYLLENNRHFWRGLVDGDGSISIQKSEPIGYATIQICGSDLICQQFSDFIKENFSKTYLSPHRVSGTYKDRLINCYRCCTSGVSASRIVKYLYSDCLISLDRKQKIADKIIDRLDAYIPGRLLPTYQLPPQMRPGYLRRNNQLQTAIE